MDRTEENRQEYKESQHRVKREVSKAKQKAYDELYTRLDTREGEKDLYRLTRQRDRDGKDVQQVRVIKDRDGRVLTNLEKEYDRVPREELWYCMRTSGVAEKYVRVVQDMYERSRTVVRCAVGQAEEFKVEVGLHQEPQSKSKVCANVFCGAGRECAVTEKGEPTCLCIEQCKPHKRSVCGSNGKTYRNHCELHRDACLTGLKIQVAHDGHCRGATRGHFMSFFSPLGDCITFVAPYKRHLSTTSNSQTPNSTMAKTKELSKDTRNKTVDLHQAGKTESAIERKTEKVAASPVVCYVGDRNELRRRVIEWLQTEVVPDGWFNKGSNFTDILLKYFKNYDNGDSQLDSAELLNFIQHNESAVELHSYAEEENNRLLRSLCVDALIELSDQNADWKLSFDEFLNCLRPGFNPPEKKCALEDETYEDGAETQVDCNLCVCACGNWVCTAMTCDEKTQALEPANGDDTMTEEEWSLRVAELNKHQETMEQMKSSTKEV
ncbi:hypothetical protein QTP70_030845 [Hemibagrus guttatus]|uniref:Follistatin-related protein 1 n=1 Tax=Hemibagrus guttatus TaxID=175788 RepID=A0AAE0V869_9TELE|nr:hypothetical protein QTP70_030845 [Hemibagrus guttatus]